MSDDTIEPPKWKRIGDFVSTEIDDSIVILSLEAGRYYSFTPTGSVIWTLLDEPQSVENLVDALVRRFEIGRQSCAASVSSFLDTLAKKDLVGLSDEPGRALVVPTQLVWRGHEPIITFGEVSPDALKLPFWHQTLQSARPLRITPLDALTPEAHQLRTAGFIFHMNRCGSTLAARQLSALPRTFAISEPFAFQHLLDRPDADLDRRARRLRTLLDAHAAALAPLADTLVIKWSGQMGLYAAEIERALPGVPSVFLHRRATEVLASVGAAPLGGRPYVRLEHFGRHQPADLAACSALEVSARVIANICDQVARAVSIRSLGYAELPQASWQALAPDFGIAIGEAERAAMARAAEPHAKHPAGGGQFAGDAWREGELRNPEVRRLARTLVGPSLVACLQRLRPLTPLRESPCGFEAPSGV